MRSLFLISDISDVCTTYGSDAAVQSGADILVLDLARPGVEAVAACDFIRATKSATNRPRLYVRVPALDDAMALPFLDAAIGAGAEGIVLPDALGGQDVTRLDARIAVEEAVHAIDHGSVRIIAEAAGTARAAMGLASFRGASQRLTGLIWSADRLAADLGGISVLTPDGALRPPLFWAAGVFLVAAASAGVTAIIDVGDTAGDGLALYTAAREDGFGAGLTRDPAIIAGLSNILAAPKA